MHRALLIALAAIAAVVAITLARGMSSGSNIDARQKYWEKELAHGVKVGSTKAELEAFVSGHGQTLGCYTNGKRQDQCDFDDNQSLGGSRNMPMRLAVIFAMQDDKVAGIQYSTSFATKP